MNSPNTLHFVHLAPAALTLPVPRHYSRATGASAQTIWCGALMVSARPAFIALAALTALSLAACGAPKGGGPQGGGTPEVGVVTLQAAPVTLTTELPGRTSPYEVSDVRPQVSGIVKARLFKEGSAVKAGQLLYRIDPAPYQAAYDQAKAQLANAVANVATTQNKAQRYADLVKINAVSRQDLDDAQAAYKSAAAGVQQQKAALESAKINLDYTRVTAPIGGRIGASAVTVGALVTAQQTTALATIQRLDPIYVDVTQSASDELRLRRELAGGQVRNDGAAGLAVRLKLDDGSDYGREGRLQFTDVTVDQASGAVTLRAVFPNPEGLLLPGLYVRALVVEGVQEGGILAPQQGVSRDDKGQPTALVVDGAGRAQLRELRTSRQMGNQWLVTDGLKSGDRLIVEGLLNAKAGQPVRAVPAGSPPTHLPYGPPASAKPAAR
jgi:membrane fusion protein (multidrug efflux system)